jgi:hypothetical protein
VTHGQRHWCPDLGRSSSGGRRPQPSKLVMPVRSRSPAPIIAGQSANSHHLALEPDTLESVGATHVPHRSPVPALTTVLRTVG